MYEVNPLAMLIEQAGGAAIDGRRRVLEIEPTELHERAPFIAGSVEDVEEARAFMAEDFTQIEAEVAQG
jgi:fructose-1,6-bisphosphatase I